MDTWIVILIAIVVIIAIFIARRQYRLQCDPITNMEETTKVFSFGGGGSRSVAFYSAAMGAVIHRENKDRSVRLHLNEYLNKFHVLGGNSGGSWFNSLMVYSPKFYNMLDGCGEGRDLFGDCYSLKSLDRFVTSCGSIEGATGCMHGEAFRCCCHAGYKPSNDSNFCIKCQDPGYFTLSKYLKESVTNAEYLFQKYKENSVDRIDEEYNNEVLTFLLQDVLGISAYSFLKLAGGDFTYNDIVKYAIFKSVGDITPQTTIDSSPNGFTNIVSWATTIINNAYTTTATDNIVIEYDIKERNPRRYGMGTPIRASYDLGNGSGPDKLFHTKEEMTVRYKSRPFNEEILIGSSPISGSISVTDLATSSGSAVAIAASPYGVDEYVDYIRPFLGKYEKIDDIICLFNPDPARCGITSRLVSQFAVFSPILKQEGGKSIVHCDENEDDLCTQWKPDEDQEIKQSYVEQIPVRLGDGYYGGDDTGIASSLAEAQLKRPDQKRIKVVSFLNFGLSDATLGDELTDSFNKHFGVGGDCVPDAGDTKNMVDVGTPGVPFIPLKTPSAKIFESEGCLRKRAIFTGRYDDPDKWEDKQNCNPITRFCSTGVDIYAWNALSTVDNPIIGVKAGYTVDLFVVNFRVGFWTTSVFPLPTDFFKDAEQSIFVNTLTYHAQRVNKIIDVLPSNVYDVVFGDESYCPSDFKEKGYPSTNYF